MSSVFHRSVKASYPVAVAGEGCDIIDDDGRRYLDASGGAAVSCLGHVHPVVVEAVREQVGRLEWAHSGTFTNRPMEELADELVAHAPPGIARVLFVSGGSEGVEAAIKMARQYLLEIGQPSRSRIIARRQSYHCNTLGALAAGGNMWRREPYGPLLTEGSHIAPCYAWRDRRDDETEEIYGLRVADELETEIQRLGPENVAAFIAEPVVGATLGAVPSVEGYFRRIREICDRHGVLLILDEVMCGMGRTGTLHACEQDGIVPDIMVVAKGLGGGYQPIGAVMVSDTVHRGFAEGFGSLQHGHTYMGHPVACAAALAVQRIIREYDLLARVRAQGAQLRRALDERFGNHRYVGDVRGRGLLLGIELVEDRASKQPFDPSLAIHARVRNEAMQRGLMVYPMPGTINGRRGDHLVLAPPYIIEDRHIEQIVDTLAAAVDAATAT